MKKIFILFLCFMLVACQRVTSYEINPTDELKIERSVLFETNTDIISDAAVFDVDDHYAYLKVQDQDNQLYEFYRLDKDQHLELMFTYPYTKDMESLLSLSGFISKGELYVAENNFYENSSRILKINDQKEQVLYEHDGLLWIIYHNEDSFLVEEMVNNKNSHSQSYQQDYKYLKFDLKDYQMELLLESSIRIENASIKQFDIFNVSQITENGFIYQTDEKIYYYDIDTKESKELLENNDYISVYGNETILFAAESRNIHFFVKDHGTYKDYVYPLESISNILDISFTDNRVLFVYEDAFREYVGMFSEDDGMFKLYRYEYSDIDGDFYFYDNGLYLIIQNDHYLTIEKCALIF